jgi:hypothetical protein
MSRGRISRLARRITIRMEMETIVPKIAGENESTGTQETGVTDIISARASYVESHRLFRMARAADSQLGINDVKDKHHLFCI